MSDRHTHTHGRGKPPFVPALAITAIYALIELAGGWWTGSLALLSNAGSNRGIPVDRRFDERNRVPAACDDSQTASAMGCHARSM